VQAAASYLSEHQIPVVYVGALSMRPEIKKLLCLMQLLVNRHPNALIGLMSDGALSMPWADIRTLLTATRADVRLQRGRWMKDPPPGLSDAGMAVIQQLRRLLKGESRYTNPWAFVCQLVLNHGIGMPDTGDTSVRAWVQRIALWQFAYQVRSGDDPRSARLSRFLARQRLRERIGDNYVDRELPPEATVLNGVRVSTVHASKGLEFDAVHLDHINADSFGSEKPSWQLPPRWLELAPPAVLESSDADYEFEASVERNNLLYVGTSRARRYLRLYYDAAFGDKNLPAQVRECPSRVKKVAPRAAPAPAAKTAPAKAFDPPSEISFDHFLGYTTCALQYFYAHVLGVRGEDEVDSSLRARGAIMRALKGVAFESAEPSASFSAAWEAAVLPNAQQDAPLWNAANAAYQKGLALIVREIALGAQFDEPIANIGSVTVTLPWGFKTTRTHSTRFSVLRLMRRAGSDTQTLLRPMVAGLKLPGSVSLDIRYVMSDEADAIDPSKRIDATKAYKGAVRLQAGINDPQVGQHCGRCAYLTICPIAPGVA
jgi:hypothetical protein